jgi:EAL domain-containing protein (putative c-di-GMP-specific phosphodiesterase class I)
VRAVVGLSDALGISTNAEGVENNEQAAMLRALGCREAQGFLYSKAVPNDVLHTLFDLKRQAA